MHIEIKIVEQLIQSQFPQYAQLEIRPVTNSGHDNRTFHLGDDLAIRMPSAKEYEPQIQKEAKWLPFLASKLSLPITQPIGLGIPSKEYPFHWSINQWMDGNTLSYSNVQLNEFATDLAQFIKELHTIDASDGPIAGRHNFYRGGDLAIYHEETIQALEQLQGTIDVETCKSIWDRALETKWEKEPVWVHGDLAVGNIIVQNERLYGVIDFGSMGTGDPACDLVIAWTFFDSESRAIFMNQLKLDESTWKRAKGWALWKALITYDQPLSQKVIKILTQNK